MYGHSALKCQVHFNATEISSDYCKVRGNPNTYAEGGFIVSTDDKFVEILSQSWHMQLLLF